MSRTIGQIDVTSDTFEVWINRTNDLLISLATEIITANDAAANTGSVAEPRKAQLLGKFGANSIVATDELRGGNVGDLGQALLMVTTNTLFGHSLYGNSYGNAEYVNCQANVFVNNHTFFVNNHTIYANAYFFTVIANSFIKANSSVTAIMVTGNSTVANTVVEGNDIFITTDNTTVNSISIFTGNTYVKSNTSTILVTVQGNGTTSNTILSGNLVQITANVDVTGTYHTVAGNVYFDTTTMVVDASNDRIGVGTATPDAKFTVSGTANVSGATRLANTLNVIGATTLANTLAVTGNSTLTGPVTFGNNYSYFNIYAMASAANGNIGTNVSTPITIFEFPKNDYKSAKIIAQVKSLSGNTQISELVTTYSDTNNSAHLTVYATVSSPATEVLGDFTVGVTAANVQIKLLQTSINSATQVVATLIK